jgi:hypothetical protein
MDRFKVLCPQIGLLKPVGEWNEGEILAQGKRIIVTLNSVTFVDADIGKPAHLILWMVGIIQGQQRKKGPIGFLGHGSRVEFRIIRIKELEESSQ